MTSEGANLAPVPGIRDIRDRKVEYDVVNLLHPQKKTTQILPLTNGGAQNPTLDLNNPTEIIWLIPPGVYNWAESYIEYNSNIPLLANNCIYAPRDHVELDSFELYNYTSSNYYVRLLNANRYAQAVLKAELNYVEWEKDIDQTMPLCPSNAARTDASQQRRDVAGGTVLNYREPRYWDISAQGAALQRMIRIPLGLFKRTFCAINKSIAMPDQTGLRIQFLPGIAMAYTASNNNDTLTGGALLQAAQLPQITGLRLVMVQEADAQVASDLMDDAKRGFKIPVSFPKLNKVSIADPGANGTYNVQTLINTADGFKLQRTYVAAHTTGGTLWAAGGAGGTYYSNQNSNTTNTTGALQLDFIQTLLNDNPLQTSQLRTNWSATNAKGREAWYWVKPYLKGSILGLAPEVWDYNFVWLDAYDGESADTKLEGKYDNTEIVAGLPIEAGNKYTFTAQAGTNHRATDFYVWHIFQRWMYIKAGATRVVAQEHAVTEQVVA